MKKDLSHAAFKKLALSDPDVLAAYNDLEEEFQLIGEVIRARKCAGITQEKVAQFMKTTLSVVSRLESLNDKQRHSPSFATLKKYANALGCKLLIKLVPQEKQERI